MSLLREWDSGLHPTLYSKALSQDKWLAQGYTASKWQCWDLNPGLLTRRALFCLLFRNFFPASSHLTVGSCPVPLGMASALPPLSGQASLPPWLPAAGHTQRGEGAHMGRWAWGCVTLAAWSSCLQPGFYPEAESTEAQGLGQGHPAVPGGSELCTLVSNSRPVACWLRSLHPWISAWS